MRALSLTFVSLLASSTAFAQLPPASFPADGEFTPFRCDGDPSTDPVGDVLVDYTDIVGDTDDAATYYALDASHLYLRMRLADTPGGSGADAPFVAFHWMWGLDVDGDGELEALIVLDGDGGPGADEITIIDQDPDDGMTADVSLDPVGPPLSSFATVRGAGTNFGMRNADTFLTVAVPLETLADFGVAGSFRAYAGTSSIPTSIDTDWACADGEPASLMAIPVEPVAGSCGNGTIDAGEMCDDGDSAGGDGCSATCEIEPGFTCVGEPSSCGRMNDFDGDGVPDAMDADADGDGIADADEGSDDLDGDGAGNDRDRDSDGDGVLDEVEGHDADMDGVADAIASGTDADGDGIDDAFDSDDGGMDAARQDSDDDGAPDFLDADDDDDGTSTRIECPAPSAGCVDSDSDGTPDYLDADSVPGGDTDGDGLPDSVECPDMPDFADCPDTDGDGTPDFMDPDDDGDGIATIDERAVGGVDDDIDGDGLPNWLDPDANDDGIPDGDQLADSDGDGVPDYLEPRPLVPGVAGGACAATGGPGSTPWLLLLSALVLWRRRR